MRWLLPLGVVSVLVIPQLSPNAMEADPVLTPSQAPTRSALASNRYTQLEPEFIPVTENAFASLTDYTYRATFGDYAFYDREEDGSFRVVDLTSGYLWASSVDYDYLEPDSPLADPDDIGLNIQWQFKLSSPFFLTYYQGVNLREEHAFQHHLSRFTFTRVTTGESVGFDVSIFLSLSKISFSFSVRFNEDGVAVHVPFSSIQEGGDFALASISMYPMLGATKRLRTPGYVVIPDGVGARIRYSDNPNLGVYSKRYYGGDVALSTQSNEQPLVANMYGLVHGHGQHAMLGIIDQGASHAILNHFGSQVFLDFNFTYVTFVYRTTYRQYLNQAKTSSVNLLQQEASGFDATMQYQFIHEENATYVGLARQYASWRFRNVASTVPTIVPLHIDFLALETKPGLFAREKVVMTDVKALTTIMAEVIDDITPAVYAQYLGWQEGGYSLTAPRYANLDPRLGQGEDLTSFVTSLPATSQFKLAVDPYRAAQSGTGYQTAAIAQSIGQEFLTSGPYYHLSSEAGSQGVNAIRSTISQWDMQGLALETIGHLAYSNFARTPVSKETMVKSFATVMTPQDSVYQPMSYAWHAGALLDMPMYSSEQARFTDTIPLIPYMLAGHRPSFARAGNFFSNTTNELLRMMDYHLYPAFFITEASAYALIDTPSENIFTSRYQDWSMEMKTQYDFISEGLEAVLGHYPIAREVLDLGVVSITYDHGVMLNINYTGQAYQKGQLTIPAMGYLVEGFK
jgi:hypothetical protein